jgi:glycerol-3-phosphate dehydrogenase
MPPNTPPTRRILRPLIYLTTGSLALGSALYISYRPRSIPGSEGAAVPPPGYGEGGTLRPPRFPHVKSRQDQIEDLKRSNAGADARGGKWEWLTGVFKQKDQRDGLEHDTGDGVYDLLVIGGGATGTGIALDAATRGLKVAVVERDDFSSGTSSKSTKLVHGGVRYLEKAVWELDYNQ